MAPKDSQIRFLQDSVDALQRRHSKKMAQAIRLIKTARVGKQHPKLNKELSKPQALRSTQKIIKDVGQEVINLLLEKNQNYGDTANNPPQIFSKLSAKEGILARIDDKLSRIKKLGFFDPVSSEDTLKDLIGYLILLKVQIEKEQDGIRKRILDSKPKINE